MKTKITQLFKKSKAALMLALALTLLLNNLTYAQCDDASVDDLTLVGPYTVATLTESDGIRNGPDYSQATVYYPTDATGQYTSVVLVPGFTNQASDIESWGPFYASHGIIAFIINVNNTFDQPDKRALAILDAIVTLKQENTRSNSPLEGKIDVARFAVSGYSMGGGGAQLAANTDTSIKAVIGLSPWLPNTTSSTFGNNQSATLLISGENDSVAAPSEHADLHYLNTPNTTDKALYELDGGNHSAAQLPENIDGSVGKIALAWLRVNLEDNACFCNLLTNEVLVDSTVSSKIDTSFSCATLSTDDFEVNKVTRIYPNPASSEIFIKSSNFISNMDYNITNVSGQLLMFGNITSSKQKIDISDLASSVYFLNIGETTFKIVKTN